LRNLNTPMAEIKKVWQPLQNFSDPNFDVQLADAPSHARIICKAVINTLETIAVTLGSEIRLPLLNNNTFYQVSVICKNDDDPMLAELMLEASFQYAEEQHRAVENKPIGVIYTQPDTKTELRTSFTAAKFYLFGFSKAGDPLYVKYFKGVRI
jgi:hypothetical protein